RTQERVENRRSSGFTPLRRAGFPGLHLYVPSLPISRIMDDQGAEVPARHGAVFRTVLIMRRSHARQAEAATTLTTQHLRFASTGDQARGLAAEHCHLGILEPGGLRDAAGERNGSSEVPVDAGGRAGVEERVISDHHEVASPEAGCTELLQPPKQLRQ